MSNHYKIIIVNTHYVPEILDILKTKLVISPAKFCSDLIDLKSKHQKIVISRLNY
jgi:hypothetical protein